MKKILTLLITFITNISFAQASTDYLQIIDDLNYGAKIASSMANCRTFGFTVPKVNSESFIDGFVTQAVKDGMNLQDAQSTLLNALKQEKVNQDYIYNKTVDAIAEIYGSSEGEVNINDYIDNKDLNEWLNYWWQRCDEISQNEFGATFIAKDTTLTMDAGIAKAKAHMIESDTPKPKLKNKKTKKK